MTRVVLMKMVNVCKMMKVNKTEVKESDRRSQKTDSRNRMTHIEKDYLSLEKEKIDGQSGDHMKTLNYCPYSGTGISANVGL